MVNRVWLHHFGSALVATPSDFGARSEPPTHPQLLDYLAADFMAHGWSIKRLVRQIVLSRTYQQTSTNADDGMRHAESDERVAGQQRTVPPSASRTPHSIDPDNRLLWRMNEHRLSFEEARDAWLAAAGRLDVRVGGAPAALFASDNTRRTLYALVDRESLPAVMRGAFISLEGVEGVGKSTNVAFTADVVRRAGHEVVTTREPGGTQLGERPE